MKRLTSAGSLILTQPRFRTRQQPPGRLFTAASPSALNVAPGQYQLRLQFHLKYAGSTYYHYSPIFNLSDIIGVANNIGRTPPPVISPWLGGKMFNYAFRGHTIYKSTMP